MNPAAGNDSDPGDRPLFAYGTLMFEDVIRAVVGGAEGGDDAVLPGFRRRLLRGVIYPGVVPSAGASVAGRLWAGLPPESLERLDAFEGPLYRREVHRLETLGRATEAWVYVVRPGRRWMMTSRDWEPELFRARSLGRYLWQLAHD